MFEIFISYKHTDDNGHVTRDSVIANDLYEKLTGKGYSVFCAEKSLKSLGSSRYKSDIDDALDKAQVMIVVLTKAEYARSQWVRYEWDSFFGDILSSVKPKAKLFTLTENVSIHDLPRSLRTVQNFSLGENDCDLFTFVSSCLTSYSVPKVADISQKEDNPFYLMRSDEITPQDIQAVLDMEAKVYSEDSRQVLDDCLQYFHANPDIYLFMRDKETGKIVANIDIAPISDECYEKLRSGHFTDVDITPDMILSYDMPFLYNIYFSSIVIDKQYRNTTLFLKMFNAVVERFLSLGDREIYAKRMIADAVTDEGEKFCKLFGMKKVKESDRHSKLYEVSLLPPEFRVSSKATKKLYEYYKLKYEEVKDFYCD